MASASDSTPVGSDGGKTEGMGWNRRPDSRFVWEASSPTPADVLALERLFPEVIQVSVQALEEESADWGLKAVIARSLSRWVPSEAFVRELRRAGVSGDVETVSLAHRHHLLRFSDPAAKAQVLGRPWVVNGQIMAVEDWRPQFVPSPDSLSCALLWIRLPSLPIEFWTEGIVSSILSVAGDFLYLDSATKDRKCGGFARACVRVDLSKPLRPGARVRGGGAPFWQQFSYEHLEGICEVCGSLHPAGRCAAAPVAVSSPKSKVFGPWMAALRRRRDPASLDAGSGRMPQQDVSGGWQAPKKVARRQLGRKGGAPGSDGHCPDSLQGVNSGKKVMKVAQGDGHSGLSGSATAIHEDSEVNLGKKAVCQQPQCAVPVGTEGLKRPETSLQEFNLNTDVNPFALLGSDKWAGRPRERKEANPGPLKRARPVESLAPRVNSKNLKGKGKRPGQGKGAIQSTVSFSASMDELKDPVTFVGEGSKVNQTTEIQVPEGTAEASQLMLQENRSHDSVVSLLKKAIQLKATAEVMDRQDQGPLKGVLLDSCPPDAEMVGELEGPPPSG